MARINPVTMPKFGLAMTEGKVASWLLPEGREIAMGDEIAEIETSKITSAYESPVAGLLCRHVAQEQTDLPVGALIAVVTEGEVADSEVDEFIERFQREFVPENATSSDQAGTEPQKLSANGRAFRYLALGAGDGPPLVLLHGFGGDLNTWMFNQPALAGERRTFAIDLPGHGGSDKHVGDGDVAAFSLGVLEILDALGIPLAHLVGHSLGGAIALHLALHHPRRVASLSLICPAALGSEINAEFIGGFIKADRRRAMRPVLEQLVAKPELISGDMIEETLKYKRLDGVTAALSTTAEANFAHGKQKLVLRNRLAELAMPVQVIWGEQDRIIPPRHADALGERITVHKLPGAGHLPHMEKSGDVNRLLAAIAG
jgi:pyruvate dehydrogenase E2 component (dihydrolipoamide acetyltransferase)